MDFNTFRQELRELLIDGKTQAALDKLLDVYDDIQGEYYDELIVIAGRMRRLRDKSIAGAIGNDEANRQANSINHSLLQIIDDLPQDEAIARHFNLEIPKRREIPDDTNTSTSKSSIWKTLLGVVVGVILTMLAIRLFTPTDDSQQEDKKETLDNRVDNTIQEENRKEEIPSNYKPREERIQNTTPTDRKEVESRDQSTTPAPVQEEEASNNSLFRPKQIALNKTIGATLSDRDDVDVYAFKTSGYYRNLMKINVLPESEDLRLRLTLYDSERSQIGTQIATNEGANLMTTFSLAPSSTYLLKIENYVSDGGKYKLSITPKANKKRGAVEKEANNDVKRANLIALNTPIYASIYNKDDRDYFRINIPKAGRLKLRFDCLSEELRGRINVFDENNNRILQHTANGKGANFEQEFSVRAGDYIIAVGTYISDFGDYSLSATLK